MSPAKVIPDGAGVTNHFRASFAPWIPEANFTQITGLGDEVEVIDGPDARGYVTGKTTRRDLTVVIPSHDPAAPLMAVWKDTCENGLPGHNVAGTLTISDANDQPIAIYEVENCICKMFEANDLQLDGAEVAQETYTISYARMKRIGP